MTILTQYGLDYQDYLIFLSLHRDPFSSSHQLSKEIGISAETIRKRISKLKKIGFLRPDRAIDDPLLGKRQQSEVESIYIPQRIGLLRQHVFFRKIPNNKALEKLISLCEIHPYTHYRVVTFSEGLNLYAQFDIPPTINKEMIQLYDTLHDQKLFASYSIFNTQYVGKSIINFKNWSFNFSDWNLIDHSPFGYPNQLEGLWKTFLDEGDIKKPKKVEPKFVHKFDLLDMKLLRELTINAKVSVSFLESQYDRDVTTISRRISNLKKKVATQSILYYDRSAFNLDYVQMISGEINEDTGFTPKNILSFLESGYVPFDTQIVIDKNRFIWYMHTPSTYAPMFSDFAWRYAKNVEIFQLYSLKGRTYYFYYENYLGKQKWNDDKGYVLDIPLQMIFKGKK